MSGRSRRPIGWSSRTRSWPGDGRSEALSILDRAESRRSEDRVFSDARQRDAMMVDLLDALLRRGAVDLDGAMRATLTPRDLAGLVPWEQRERLSLGTAEALCDYLDGQWDVSVLSESLASWRSTMEATRGSLRWRDLPPVVERLARLYAEALLARAESKGWVGRLEMSDLVMWKLSDAGGDALQRLRRSLARDEA